MRRPEKTRGRDLCLASSITSRSGGTVSVDNSKLNVGQASITATYRGNSDFVTSSSTVVVQTVQVGCPSGQTFCYDACEDLNTDPNNCGPCGNICVTENDTPE